MSKTNVILFPNMRAPIIEIVRMWNARGYWLSSTKHGHLVLIAKECAPC